MRPSLFILLGFVLLGPACQRSPVLAKVGGESITDADLEELAEINPRLKPRLASPMGKRKILENYVEQTLLHREATRRGLHRMSDTRKKLSLYKKIIIAQAALDNELERKVKEYYDNHRDEFERVKVAHILVRTTSPADEKGKKPTQLKRTDAQALQQIEKIQTRLQNGEDFAKVAEQISEDEWSKKNGGSLGEITLRDKRLERKGWLALAENAFALPEGQVSSPIKTPDGLHLLKVEGAKSLQPLEEAEPAIRFRLQPQVRRDLMEELKKKYKVKFLYEAPTEPAKEGIEPGMPPETPSPTPGGG